MSKRWTTILMCCAVLVVGCSSRTAPGHTTTASNPTTSATAAPSALDSPLPTVAVSIGSPTPSDSESISHERAVQAMLERLLDEVQVPPGSTDLHGAQAGAISGPPQSQMSDDLLDLSRTWRAPGTDDVVLQYLKAHVPPGLTFEGSSNGTGGDWVFYTHPAGPLDEGATFYFSVLPDVSGGVDLRVDAQDIWRPNRTAGEQVPSTVTGATVVRTVTTNGGLPSTLPPSTTLQVGAQQAQRMAALLNALPTFANGAPPGSGGPPTAYAITFTSGVGTTFTVGDDFGLFAVYANVNGVDQPIFEDASALVSYLDSLFAAP